MKMTQGVGNVTSEYSVYDEYRSLLNREAIIVQLIELHKSTRIKNKLQLEKKLIAKRKEVLKALMQSRQQKRREVVS